MPQRSDYLRVLGLSAELASLRAPGTRRDRITAALGELVPGDDTFYTRLDLAAASSVVQRGDGRRDAAFADDITRTASDNPAVISYLDDPCDLAPRRMSDLGTDADWMRTASYNEAFRRRGGRYQLSLVCRLDAARSVGEGWIVTRNRRDFTDAEVDLAALLLPTLIFASRADALGAGVISRVPRDPEPPLTAAEIEVLRLLGQGLTARAIGQRRQIAAGTVRKHLEHIYAKFGVHDRLEVTLIAEALGLLA